jgi:hypothetical protein
MICYCINLFFTSNLLPFGIGLQSQLLLNSRGTSDRERTHLFRKLTLTPPLT